MKINQRKEEMYELGRPGVRQMELKEIEVVEKVEKMTYSQDWPSYNAAKTQEKTIAQIILSELMEMYEQFEGPPRVLVGRPSIPLRDRMLCMFTYSYNKASSRRSIPDMVMLKNCGLIRQKPHFNSILNMFRDDYVTHILTELIEITSMPLQLFEEHLNMDSSGFSCSTFERWMDVRTQEPSRKRLWKKAHVVSGAKTHIIASVAVTDGHENDSPQLEPLVTNASKRFSAKEFSADKAYLSRKNLRTVATLGMIPYIPFKSNSVQQPKGYRIWATMFAFFYGNREKFMERYHLRSNSETVFSMIKKTFGHKLRTKSDEGQVNEILMKCLCHNLTVLVQESFELGLEMDIRKCVEQYFAQIKQKSAQK